MARALARLKPVEMPRLVKKPGMHCDGHGLYLRVAPPSAASWVLRYMIDGRARTMGLGPYPEIKLAEARERALQARKLKVDGNDPIEVRRLERAAKRLAAAKTLTFKECAAAYIKSHREGWKSEKHAAQWVSTLVTYSPTIWHDDDPMRVRRAKPYYPAYRRIIRERFIKPVPIGCVSSGWVAAERIARFNP